MKPDWKRISGMCVLEDATVGVVWVAIEPDAQIIHVYDCVLWKNETFPTMADGIANRGRWIPLAWDNKEYADKLLFDWGVNTLPERVSADPAVAAVETREVFQRMKARQFRAKKGLRQWIDEWQSFNREGGKVPLGSHPLMSATWYAVANLQYAKAEQTYRHRKHLHQKVAMI